MTHVQNPCSMNSMLGCCVFRNGHRVHGRLRSCCRRCGLALHGQCACHHFVKPRQAQQEHGRVGAKPVCAKVRGSATEHDSLDRASGEAFDVKVQPKIGPPTFGGQAGEGNHLGRTIAKTPRGVMWCGNPQHVADITTLMGLTQRWTCCRTNDPSCPERPRARPCTLTVLRSCRACPRHGIPLGEVAPSCAARVAIP